jgi:hypothetical protein
MAGIRTSPPKTAPIWPHFLREAIEADRYRLSPRVRRLKALPHGQEISVTG